jgi:hypothetical protein
MSVNTKSDLALQHHLVVISAVGKPDIALKAWNKLIQLWDVEELDSISLRFLPAIYVNIGHLDTELNPKLSGKYRYNSVRNIERLRSLKPVIGQFDKLTIDYRLVKGFAISLRIKTLGYRIMGDIDFVIRRNDLENVLRIFSEFDFTDKFFIDCEKYSISSKKEKYTLINNGGTEIDLHVAENAFPSKILKKMLQEKPLEVYWEGILIKIPSDQSLISHSLLHGLQGTAVTDRWQTLVDINTLERVKESHKPWTILSLNNRIARAFNDDSKIFDSTNKHYFDFVFKAKLLKTSFWINKLLSHRFTFKTPNTDGITSLICDKKLSIRTLAYCAWASFAARSLLENFVCKTFGGFLKQPKLNILSSNDYLPHREVDTFSVLQNILDYRFRVKTSLRVSKMDIYFHSKVFQEKNYEIFCNGIFVGVSNKSGHFGISYFGEGKDFEISIRNPNHSCERCFSTFENLKIRFEYEDLI